MKKIIFITLYTMSISLISAQDSLKIQKEMLKVNFLTPGLSFEKSISNNTSLNFDLNLSLGYVKNNTSSNILLAPYIRGQYRYYYNLSKRISKNKKTSGNSANFLAINSSYYFKTLNNQNYISVYDNLSLGGVWGLQRTYKSGLNINLITGVGYNFSELRQKKVIPIINFTLGWKLFDK